MERSGTESFCCGAGGGSMWLDVPGKTRVENLRAAEAAATGAATVVTGCPFCKGMLQAGQQSLDPARDERRDGDERLGGVVGSSTRRRQPISILND